ncbi:MAG TPA: efflux RND transporter permease subunit [Bacteroidetes bacterium]|nr:efflux RND transporter permease subunit [Bacteroidota bacterium]
MSLYSNAVKRPVTTMMVFIGVFIFGLYAYFQLPVDFFPKMDPPYITVFTFYQGANAADIEENVTRVLEDRLSSLSNLKNMTSSSKDNVSVITLEYNWGTNLDEATNEVRDAVGMAERSLPDGVEKPTIFKFSTSMMPVMMLSATADQSYAALKDILEDNLVNPINRLDGVGSVFIIGAPIRAVMVDVDPRKLDAYHLSLEQLGSILAANNFNLPAGNMEMGKSNLALRVQGEFSNSDQIKNLIISNVNGKTVRLKDVATVTDSLKKVDQDERINGRKGVRLMIQKQSDANTVTVAREIKKKLPDLIKNLPPDVKIETIFDTSEYTQASINNLTETVLYALLFVVVVVLFFLGRWRATFIVALSIPISLIVGFIYMLLTGNTINIITLSSIAIAIGMVVDDSIVVLENTTKHIERGSYPREASIYGTNEVSTAVMASTLTVMAVFLPLTMVGGMTGILFRPLGWIVTITIATSVIVALTLTPMLSSKMLTNKLPDKKKLGGKLYYISRNLLDWLDRIYEKTLTWAVRHRWTIITGSLAIFLASIFLVGKVGTEFMPSSDNNQIGAVVKLAQGVNMKQSMRVARKLEDIFRKKYPEIEITATSTGAGDENSLLAIFTESGNYIITFTFKMIPLEQRSRDIFMIADMMRKDIEQFPEIEKFNVDPGNNRRSHMMGMGGGNNLEVKIFGHDFDQTDILAEKIANEMKHISGTRDVLISRDRERPEMQFVLDQDKMTFFGLNTVMVATALRNRVNGLTATKYREKGKEYDVIVRYAEKFRKSTQDIENITIQTPMGKMIKLKEIGEIKQFYTQPNIDRENKERIVTVSSLISGSDLGSVASQIRERIAGMNIPEGVSIEIGGNAEDMQENFKKLGLLMLVAFILVYVVMSAQFESLTEPFIIMFSIPFAFTGVFLALYLTHTTLNVISMIGAVMLIGIVVKNGIVLVDFTNLLRDRGLAVKQAVVQGGKSRLRPVLMTALTTLLAMVPLAISTGEGSSTWRPMAIAIIGGLLFSTLITLVLIPTIYSMFGAARVKRAQRALLKRTNGNSSNS